MQELYPHTTNKETEKCDFLKSHRESDPRTALVITLLITRSLETKLLDNSHLSEISGPEFIFAPNTFAQWSFSIKHACYQISRSIERNPIKYFLTWRKKKLELFCFLFCPEVFTGCSLLDFSPDAKSLLFSSLFFLFLEMILILICDLIPLAGFFLAYCLVLCF